MAETPVAAWLTELAGHTPAPGGGAAAALCAATAAGLVGMVTSYTTGPRWAEREARMRDLNDEASRLRASALELAEQDMAAYGAVGDAYRLPRETPEEKAARRLAVQRALVQAAGPPARVGRLAVRVVEIAGELVDSGNPSVISDVAVASSAARAALESAIVNIEINRRGIEDEAEVARLDATVEELGDAMLAADRVTGLVRQRLR